MSFLGIDIGSLSCDAVIIDDDGNVLGSAVVPTGARNQEAMVRARREALEKACLEASDIEAVVSTGYGRDRVDDRMAAVTEISCHAKGMQALRPGVSLLVDIGGQDSKAIRLDASGNVDDFVMNDKCAAGTGRFLEAMARALEVDIDRLCNLDVGAKGGTTLSSMCTVFAESEVVSLIADGVEVREIVWGLNRSISSRIFSMSKRIIKGGAVESIAMSGGVARNDGVVRALAEAFDCELFVPPDPDTVGAYGAALIARDKMKRG